MPVTDTSPFASPWFSMWTRPRATIQSIVERGPTRFVLLLAALYGISQALDQASAKNAVDTLPLVTVLLIALIGGAISGIITLYVGGFLLKHTGQWLDGKANSEKVRAAMAWSSVPIAWGLLLWIPELLIFGGDLFTSTAERIAAHAVLYFLFMALELIVAFWAMIIFFKSLGQVHGFSAWRAFGATFIAFCLIIVPLLSIALVIGALN